MVSRISSIHFPRALRASCAISAGLGAMLAFTVAASADLQSCRVNSEKGLHASAIRACTPIAARTSASDATRGTALFYRANSLYSTREVEGALDDINGALQFRPNFGPAYALRGAIRLETGANSAAESDLSRAIELGYTTSDVLSRRATARLNTGDVDGAASDLQSIIEDAPRDAIAHLRLAVALNELGRNDDALGAVNRAVELNADNGDAYGVRAKIRSETGDLDGALEDYARAETGAAEGARYLVGKADLLARAGHTDDALAAVNEALSANAPPRTAALLKADILETAGRPAEARSALVPLMANDALLALRSARLAIASDNLEAALADYSTAITLDDGMGAAYFERGQIRERQGDLDAAISDFDAALAADAGFADRRLHYLRGKAKYRAGDFEGAVGDLDSQIEIADTADSRLWRALAKSELGEFEAALDDAGRLVAMAPGEARAQAVLGDVLLRAGRIDDGRDAHRKALELDPSFAPSRQRIEELAATN